MPLTRPRHWVRWLIGAIVVVAALAVAGPFVYIHFFNGSTPAALSLSPSADPRPRHPRLGAPAGSPSAAPGDSGTVSGTWTVGSGSVVGYRVNEVLLGQNTTAVGRTSSVTGSLTLAGSTATAASFRVPMATVRSDKSQRDAQFDGRIMDVARYPNGSFALTGPISLAPLCRHGPQLHRAREADPARHDPRGHIHADRRADRGRYAAQGGRRHPGAVLRLQHPEPQPGRLRDHAGSRPAGVPPGFHQELEHLVAHDDLADGWCRGMN